MRIVDITETAMRMERNENNQQLESEMTYMTNVSFTHMRIARMRLASGATEIGTPMSDS